MNLFCRTWDKRLKPLGSPAASVDSGNVEDIFTTRSLPKPQYTNYYTVDSNKYSHTNQHRGENSMSHTLPPIRELSANDLTNHINSEEFSSNQNVRSVTPTTDSAINMSRSASSSDDESYRHKRHHKLPRMHEVVDRMHQMRLSQSEESSHSSDDQTLESNSTVLTTSTLSPETVIIHRELSPVHRQTDRQQTKLTERVDNSVPHSNNNSDGGKLTAGHRQSSGRPLPTSAVLPPKLYRNTGYSQPSSNPIRDTIVGDEVELEIMFPVRSV